MTISKKTSAAPYSTSKATFMHLVNFVNTVYV